MAPGSAKTLVISMSGKRDFSVMKILDLWLYNDSEWITFKDIERRTGISKRSLARYLKELVERRSLAKDKEKGYKLYSGSFDENLVQALKTAKARESWKTSYSAEKKSEIAKKMLIAHLDMAAREIAEVALKVFSGAPAFLVTNGELVQLWVDSFLADFYEQLARCRQLASDIFIARCGGRKPDALESSK